MREDCYFCNGLRCYFIYYGYNNLKRALGDLFSSNNLKTTATIMRRVSKEKKKSTKKINSKMAKSNIRLSANNSK